MSCRISTGRINTIIGKSRAVSTLLEQIIKTGRLDPPLDIQGDATNFFDSLGAAQVQCLGYAVPAGPSFVKYFLDTIGSGIPIPDQSKYLDWDIDFSDDDITSRQNLQGAISDLKELLLTLDCSTSDDFGICISEEALEDYRSRVSQSIQLLEQPQLSSLFDDYYGMSEPCFAGSVKSILIIPYSVVNQIAAERNVVETVINTMTQGKRIASYTYDCESDPDVPAPPDDDNSPVDDEKCDRLIEAIENFQLDFSPLTEKIDAIDIPACPEIDYDRIINGVFQRIQTYLDPKFPSLNGMISIQTCEGDVAQEFPYGGDGLVGLASQNLALAKAVEANGQELCRKADLPIVIMPDDSKQDFTISTQLEIVFVPVNERNRYNKDTPTWRIHIPNPIAIDWCTHLEPLIWERGAEFFGRIRWQERGTWTGGYFASRENTIYIMSQLINLSTSPVLDNPPRITENPSAKRGVKRVNVIPLRGTITRFDSTGDVTDVQCLRPPSGGCG